MTVGELIVRLQTLPPELPVLVNCATTDQRTTFKLAGCPHLLRTGLRKSKEGELTESRLESDATQTDGYDAVRIA